MNYRNLPPYIHFFKEKTYPEFQDVMSEDIFDDLTVDLHNRCVAVRNIFRQYGMEPVVEIESYNNEKFRGVMGYINYEGFTVSVGFSIATDGQITHEVHLEDDEEYEESWGFPEWGPDKNGMECYVSTMIFMVNDFINTCILPGNR